MLGIKELTYTAMIGFLIVIILGPIFIPMLARFKFNLCEVLTRVLKRLRELED